MAVDAIIFDFDGTIVDTETPDYESWRDKFRAHGHDLDISLWKQRVGMVVGPGIPDLFQPAAYFETLTGIMLDDEALRLQHEDYLARCAAQPVLPGVREVIAGAKARGIGLGIASNSDRPWVVKWATHFGVIDYFPCLYTRDDVVNAKPAPDMYLAAAECLGVPPERCVVIEDSPTGMRGALAAGMRVVAVPNVLTEHLERPAVALTARSLAEVGLEGLLARFG